MLWTVCTQVAQQTAGPLLKCLGQLPDGTCLALQRTEGPANGESTVDLRKDILNALTKVTFVATALALSSVASRYKSHLAMPKFQIEEKSFGVLPDGKGEVREFKLENGCMTVSLINYGATILSVQAPDRDGHLEEITLNRHTVAGLLEDNQYYGTTIGRVANRIANARFHIDGKDYQVTANEPPNQLHGGFVAFSKHLWLPKPFENDNSVGVCFTYISPDGEEGYPGTVKVEATYALTSDNQLEMSFLAKTDAPTPLAMTNHGYWNLSGLKRLVTEGQTLRVPASVYLPIHDRAIPTGEQRNVAGTPNDLREEARIGDRVPLITNGNVRGLDACFGVDHYEPLGAEDENIKGKARLMASLKDPHSGRAMDVYGTQPGLQVYTANHLSQEFPFVQHNAICLETEFFPSAVNIPSFGQDIIIRPGKPYRHYTVHNFYIV